MENPELENEEYEATSNSMQEPQNTDDGENNKDVSYATDFDQWIEEKPKRQYIRLKQVGESAIIRFPSGRPYSSKMSDFNGTVNPPKAVFTYKVTTPDAPNEQKDFDVTSKRLARDIKFYVVSAPVTEVKVAVIWYISTFQITIVSALIDIFQ